MTTTQHPALDRLGHRAAELGSRATTVRGMMRAVRGRYWPRPAPMDAQSYIHARAERIALGQQRLRFHAPREQVRALADLRAEVEAALERCQARATVRTLTADEAFAAIVHNQPIDGGQVTARSYSYRYQTTVAGRVSVAEPGFVGWSVSRDAWHPGTAPVVGGYPTGIIPMLALHGAIVSGPALLDGDLCALRPRYAGAGDYWIRYAADGRRTGVCVPMPAPLQTRYGRWEHGRKLAECRAEIAAKRRIVAAHPTLVAASYQRRMRAAQLLARLSRRLTASFDDARAAGYCRAGITAWAERRGLSLDTRVPLARLTRDPDQRARDLAVRLAQRALP